MNIEYIQENIIKQFVKKMDDAILNSIPLEYMPYLSEMEIMVFDGFNHLRYKDKTFCKWESMPTTKNDGNTFTTECKFITLT